jgi:holliday junction DNA helicase RuvA
MIALVKGIVHEVGEGYVVVETPSGVGYRVSVSPASVLWDTMKESTPVTLYTSHHIRENEEGLYGFASPEERNFYEQLLTVSGVGPKLASSLVAVLGKQKLAEMILSEDIEGIDAVPGIGRKMAERIVVYLRDTVLGEDTVRSRGGTRLSDGKKDDLNVVRQALERLGFNSRERELMLDGLSEADVDGKSIEDILKELLGRQSSN